MNDEITTEISPPIHPSSFILHPSTFSQFLGGVMLSYVIAGLIFGVATIHAWMWQSSADFVAPHVARDGTRDGDGVATVGRITAMAACQWADPNAAVVNPAAIPLGHKFAIESGILEITYCSGAGVILQGPAVYEVDSEDSGVLSLGRATVHVEKRGLRVKVQGLDAVNPLISHPSSFILYGTHSNRRRHQRGWRDRDRGRAVASLPDMHVQWPGRVMVSGRPCGKHPLRAIV